ncbi:phosphoserine phosphatase [Peribacillus cavernae]|uniref:Phosphoserine phosphatase n=1 Tax=Peribacillus cavernae TaxID=1674310 RepID=A0A433HF88_9BACI|nr:PP2C family serine/threonine-protein phosphatase [Peribacillus cavernae]MDQ0221317.1 negative regulator of sigma-B (phosphoserine phosphatase) [Peribacillus cavernae]RUQ26963.1 phosphoserine phosphatase [Peribacillus cavernae]
MIKEVLRDEKIEILASQSSKNGMPYCGDDYFFLNTNDYFLCVLADGLGSGKFAYESSSAVTQIVKNHQDKDVKTIMSLCNEVLVHKRGAAVSILKLYYDTKEFIYSSVGNIRFFLYNPESDKLIYPLPVTGYLSGRSQKYHTQRFKYEPYAKFFLHSDGLQLQGATSILKTYASLEQNARKILQNNTNQSDDTTFILGSLLS